ncbi:MAG: hypothetical protein QF652_01985 [Dehalococcoidia bacterium]|nr:hypothetical protein [Dehalococcoidia bacterium]
MRRPSVRAVRLDGDRAAGGAGHEAKYTAMGNHYQVFLRTELTVIEGSSWSLPITGLVENPISLTLEDIRDNYITLACISGRFGTDPKKHDFLDWSESSGGAGRRQPDRRCAYLTIWKVRADANLRGCGRYDSPHPGQACLGVMEG